MGIPDKNEAWRELRGTLTNAHVDHDASGNLFRRLRTDLAAGYEKWFENKDVDEYALAQRYFVDGRADGIPEDFLSEFRGALERVAAVDPEGADWLKKVERA